MHTNEKLKVAIVGGGFCGLTCAIALAKEGIQPEIFEAAVSQSCDIVMRWVLMILS